MKLLKGKAALIAINILGVVMLFFAAETVTRIFYPEITLSGTSSNLIKANIYGETQGLNPLSEGSSHGAIRQVDQRGFWVYTGDKKNIPRKILLIGDSVTMGIGVESDSTFAGILHNSSETYEILNASLLAYTSTDYLNQTDVLLHDENMAASIEKIYIFWCLNDVYPKHIIQDAPGYVGDDFMSNVLGILRENSKLYHLVKNIFSDRPQSYYLYDSQFYKRNNFYFQSSIEHLRKINHITKEFNIEFKIFLIPYEYQIRVKTNEIFLPQELLQESLSEFNVDVVDCSEVFLNSHIDSQRLYLFGDGIHLSNTGHRVLAKYILAHTDM
jgi:lysophospholipase L1-like esterase